MKAPLTPRQFLSETDSSMRKAINPIRRAEPSQAQLVAALDLAIARDNARWEAEAPRRAAAKAKAEADQAAKLAHIRMFSWLPRPAGR